MDLFPFGFVNKTTIYRISGSASSLFSARHNFATLVQVFQLKVKRGRNKARGGQDKEEKDKWKTAKGQEQGSNEENKTERTNKRIDDGRNKVKMKQRGWSLRVM